MVKRKSSLFFGGAALLIAASISSAQSYKFDFGPGPAAEGYKQVLSTMKYSNSAGFGFDSSSGAIVCVDRGGADALTGDFCTSNNNLPFSFSFDAPEGNYRVSVTFGDAQGPSRVTINAESHRLMVEKAKATTAQFITKTFIVNRRSPKISTGGTISLKQRSWPNTNEPDMLNWDEKLTLEFCDGSQQNIAAIEAVKIDTAIQVFLAGNSTVTDQEYSPWGSWGQMIPRFFNDKVVIVNLAESGLASSSFGNRLDKATSMMKEGDYLFLEFGHNDGSESSYNTNMTNMINAARNKKGIPVVVSPICRRYFDANGKIDNGTGQIAPYSAAARSLATKENVALVDLTAMSKSILDAVGKDKAKKLYVSYTQAELKAHNWTRFTGTSVDDNTHTNIFGAYEYAKCVREGIKSKLPELAKYLLTDIPAFDPTKPDDADAWVADWTWSPYPEVKGNTTALQERVQGPAQAAKALLSVNTSLSTISFPEAARASTLAFSLYSIRGKWIASKQISVGKNQGTLVWNRLGELPPGDYLLEMKSEGSQTRRVSFTQL